MFASLYIQKMIRERLENGKRRRGKRELTFGFFQVPKFDGARGGTDAYKVLIVVKLGAFYTGSMTIQALIGREKNKMKVSSKSYE